MKQWLLLSAILLLSQCNPKVVNFVNEEAAFEKYTAFATVNTKNNEAQMSDEGHAIKANIERAIDAQMLRRAYNKSNTNPDLIARYEIIAKQVSKTSSNSSGYYGTYYNPSFTVRTILEAVLLIELNDVKSRKVIWQASIDLSQYDKKSAQAELINEAVSRIFDTYLYTAGQNKPDPSLIENE
ncbi:MAG: DUF4136 domain-containing protein [Cyclobacteriaceae bacterium]